MRPLLRSLLAATCGAASLAAQAVDGTVLGFGGKPEPFATVRVYATTGQRLTELVTDQQGIFEYAGRLPIGLLEVQTEGVFVTVPVQDGDSRIAVSFERAPHFTLRGHLVDPIGQPMANVDLLLRDDDERTIVNVTTGDKGAFTIRLDRAIGSIVVDPLGLDYVRFGRFDRDGGVAIDLRLVRDRFFAVEGRVIDENGSPLGGVIVRGSSAKTPLVKRSTLKDGSFVLWARYRLDYVLVLERGEPLALRYGRLDGDCSVEVDVSKHGYVGITGRVVHASGAGAPNVGVFAASAQGKAVPGLRMLARTDPGGYFAARVPRTVPRILAWQNRPHLIGMARWQPDAPVEITIR